MRFKIDMKKELRQAWINVLKIEPEKTVRLTARQANDIALEYEKILCLTDVSKRLLAEKIILALDDYGRSINRVEYGLPIDPDTKDFEDKRQKEMLKIVTDILNGC